MKKIFLLYLVFILFSNSFGVAGPNFDYEGLEGFHVLSFNKDLSIVNKGRLAWLHNSGPGKYSDSKIPIPKRKVGLEINYLSIATSKDETNTQRVSSNFLFPIFSIAGVILSASHNIEVQSIFTIPAYTQIATNPKFHFYLPMIYSSFYLGENTDYYLFNRGKVIYTESVLGIDCYYKGIGISFEICKPWTTGYTDDLKYRQNLNLFIIVGSGGPQLLKQ